MLTRRQRIVPSMVLLALLTAAIFTAAAQAQSAAPIDPWKYSITPYFWLPNFNATLKYSVPPGGGGSPSVESARTTGSRRFRRPDDFRRGSQGQVVGVYGFHLPGLFQRRQRG